MPPSIDDIIRANAIHFTFGSVAILFVLIAVSLLVKKKTSLLKIILYGAIVAVVFLNTAYLASSTVYLNLNSQTKGPVHYHADYEVWDCGKELDLIDPKGISNKVGTPRLHEHNDKRIHLEGVVVEKADMSLGEFIRVVGGNLTSSSLDFPTNQGTVSMHSGNNCPDGQNAQLQVFVYKVSEKVFTQQKLTDPVNYIFASQSAVPPGDCIIFEFGPPKDKTDQLCRSFKVAKQIGKLRGEI